MVVPVASVNETLFLSTKLILASVYLAIVFMTEYHHCDANMNCTNSDRTNDID